MKVIEFQRTAYWQERNRISNALIAAENIVKGYNEIPTLKPLTDKDWHKFSENPQNFFASKVTALKKKRFGDDDIDIEVFMQLYKIPSVKFQDSEISYREYFVMKGGQLNLNDEVIKNLKERFTIKTTDPKLIAKLEKIESLVKKYDQLYKELFDTETGRHDFKEIGYNPKTKGFINEIVVKFK